jgi:pimeloyl-ACP methyl ester carboxylesterase
MGLDQTIAIEAAKWPAHGRRNNASCLLSFDIGDGYASITVPSLIIQGEKDAASPVEAYDKRFAESQAEGLEGG